MRRSSLLRCSLIVLAVASGSDTNNTTTPGDLSGDLSGTVMEDLAGADLAVEVGDLAIGCGLLGEACATGDTCCSKTCDPAAHICVQGMCLNQGDTCADPSECCSHACTATKCGTSCVFDNVACTQNGECCSGQCVSN